MIPDTSHPATPAAPAVVPSRVLEGKLQALRRKHVGVAVWSGLALVTAVAVELLAVAMFLDWWLDLPLAVRAVSLLGQALLVGYLLAWQVILPLARQPDEDALALMVEKARPELNSRLISSVQFARPDGVAPGTAVALVQGLVLQTERWVQPQDFRSIVSVERLRKLASLALTVLLLGVGGYVYGQSTCRDLLRRVFLAQIPVPRKTQVEVIDGHKTIGRGDDVRLEAFAQGLIPNHGKLEVQYKDRRALEYRLEQNQENPRHFGRTIENVQDSFNYRVHLNDGSSPVYSITAIPRPTVQQLACEQEFPAYTGLGRVARSLGDLTLLAGSRLHLVITATKDLRQGVVRLVGPELRLPLEVDPANSRLLRGLFQVPATNFAGFAVEMLDTVGMESRDNAIYRVDVLPDKKPRVRITYPERKEELVTRQATLPVGMDIEDDFAVRQVRIHYRVDSVEESAQKTLELDLDGAAPARMQRLFPWSLESFRPPLIEGSLIEFWVEAVDNNEVTGPGIAQSEHHLARVVTREQKLADILNRASDYLSGLEDLAEDQSRANRNLGAIILEKGARPER